MKREPRERKRKVSITKKSPTNRPSPTPPVNSTQNSKLPTPSQRHNPFRVHPPPNLPQPPQIAPVYPLERRPRNRIIPIHPRLVRILRQQPLRARRLLNPPRTRGDGVCERIIEFGKDPGEVEVEREERAGAGWGEGGCAGGPWGVVGEERRVERLDCEV